MTTYYFPSTSSGRRFGGAYEVQVEGTTTTILKYYSFAGGMVAMHDGTSLKYFLTDHLSSVIAVLDASGNLLSEQRYLPFGQVREDVDTINETDFGYTSQRANTYIKLYDYRSRWYDPLLGRFTQPDTIIPSLTNPQSLNRYSYVTNRPINFNDPTGHVMCDEYGNCLDHGKRIESERVGPIIDNSNPLKGFFNRLFEKEEVTITPGLGVPTPTPSPFMTRTASPTYISIPTNTPKTNPTPLPTNTNTPTATSSSTSTPISLPTSTSTTLPTYFPTNTPSTPTPVFFSAAVVIEDYLEGYDRGWGFYGLVKDVDSYMERIFGGMRPVYELDRKFLE